MKGRTGEVGACRKRRFVAMLVLGMSLAVLFAGPACSKFSRYAGRRDALQQDLNRFLMALFMQDTPALLRQIPPEARADWSQALVCFFQRYRVVDYNIQEIKTGPKVEEARVVVWVRQHPVNALATLETVWYAQWVYRNGGWFLDTESETTRTFLGDCLTAKNGA